MALLSDNYNRAAAVRQARQARSLRGRRPNIVIYEEVGDNQGMAEAWRVAQPRSNMNNFTIAATNSSPRPLTEGSLRELISTTITSTDNGGANTTIYTGSGGMREFERAMRQEAQNFQISTDTASSYGLLPIENSGTINTVLRSDGQWVEPIAPTPAAERKITNLIKLKHEG